MRNYINIYVYGCACMSMYGYVIMRTVHLQINVAMSKGSAFSRATFEVGGTNAMNVTIIFCIYTGSLRGT